MNMFPKSDPTLKVVEVLERIEQRLITIDKTLDQIGIAMGSNTTALRAELKELQNAINPAATKPPRSTVL